jgi:GT2 family glycosyltransferase
MASDACSSSAGRDVGDGDWNYMTDMAVVIVNYNTRDHLCACLEAIGSNEASEVVVVDNASTDGSPEMVRANYPWVRLIASSTNAGYGAAANVGMAACHAPYVLLLNGDTRVTPGAVHSLSSYLDLHPRAAVIGPRLVNLNGDLQASCYPFPTPLYVFLEESTLGQLIRFVPVLRHRYLRTWSYNHSRRVPWVLGAALAIRRKAVDDAGGFDESFFLYYEEVDLCLRLHSAGWEVHFAPITTVTHVGGASSNQRRTETIVQWFLSIQRFYCLHYSRIQTIELIVVAKIIVLARLIRDSIRLRLDRSASEQAGIGERVIAWREILSGRART